MTDPRACELHAQAENRRLRLGSGTLVSDRLVLTAAHLLGANGTEVTVRELSTSVERRGVVAWRGEAGLDVALVRIVDGPPPSIGSRPLRWGQLVCDAPRVPVRAVGFPLARKRQDGRRESDDVEGFVHPFGLAKAGLIDVAVISEPHFAAGSPSPWRGMSGAGLFCNDVLVGVIIQDDLPYASKRVRALPVTAFAGVADFAQLVWPGGEEVRPGLEPAELAPLQQLVEPPSSPASLLRADAAVVPFHGRDDLLARLRAWCSGREPRSAWLLTGAGGQGKTRLARHFADQVRRLGWATVVLTASGGLDDIGWLSSVRTPLFLVIDYVEHRRDQLRVVGRKLQERNPDAPLRVLMLARADGEWRRRLPDGWTFAVAHTASNSEELAALNEVPGQSERNFRRAARSFAARLCQLPGYQDITEQTWLRRAETMLSPAFRPSSTALEVQLSALVALLQADGRTPVSDPVAAAKDLLDRHEENYWDHVAGQHGVVAHTVNRRAAVAAACLLPATDREEALDILARTSIDELSGTGRTAIAEWLKALYPAPAPSQFWGGLQPDLLAEVLVTQAVADHKGLLRALLQGADDRQAGQALTLLGRAAGRRSELREQVVDVVAAYPERLAPAAVRVALEIADGQALMDALDRVVTESARQLDLMRMIYTSIPTRTLIHRRLAVHVAEHVVTALRGNLPTSWRDRLPARLWAASRRKSQADLARALNELSARYSPLDRHEAALEAADEAVRSWERLVTAGQRGALAGLAAALNNQANSLDELGRSKEALPVRRRAEAAYRELTSPIPTRLDAAADLSPYADFATTLNNLATVLRGASGTEGLRAAEESVGVARQLATVQHRYTSDLARSLNSKSLRLSELGRFEEAADAATEAVDLYESMANQRPDEHLAGLAASYNNLTRCLVELGRIPDALTASEQAVFRYRQLANADSAVHGPDLARAFLNRADCLTDLGRYEGALQSTLEAIKLYKRLMRHRPDNLRADYLRAKGMKADLLRELGRPDLAD